MTIPRVLYIIKIFQGGGAKSEIAYPISYICLDDIRRNGFFSIMRMILLHIDVADRYGLPVCVNIAGKCPYTEKRKVNGSSNVFEYFFEQPCGIAVSEAKKGKFVFVQKKDSPTFFTDTYDAEETELDRLAVLYKKYINLKSESREYITAHISDKVKEKTLGIHIRGTDFKTGKYGHPIVIGVREYVAAAKDMMKKYGFQNIFLATDDRDIVKAFQKAFKGRFSYYEDTARGQGTNGIHTSDSVRADNSYLMGLEVLRDAYTLASCEGLLAGLSQVSYAARYINKADFEPYKKVEILDHGLNL